MSRRPVPTYRHGAIRQQIRRVSGDHDRHVHQARVDRVLAVLDSDNLIAQAAAGMVSEDALLFECNVAPMVWDDPRIVFRRRHLEGNDITVELVEHEATVAGKNFKRTMIKVAFIA